MAYQPHVYLLETAANTYDFSIWIEVPDDKGLENPTVNESGDTITYQFEIIDEPGASERILRYNQQSNPGPGVTKVSAETQLNGKKRARTTVMYQEAGSLG